MNILIFYIVQVYYKKYISSVFAKNNKSLSKYIKDKWDIYKYYKRLYNYNRVQKKGMMLMNIKLNKEKHSCNQWIINFDKKIPNQYNLDE